MLIKNYFNNHVMNIYDSEKQIHHKDRNYMVFENIDVLVTKNILDASNDNSIERKDIDMKTGNPHTLLYKMDGNLSDYGRKMRRFRNIILEKLKKQNKNIKFTSGYGSGRSSILKNKQWINAEINNHLYILNFEYIFVNENSILVSELGKINYYRYCGKNGPNIVKKNEIKFFYATKSKINYSINL